MTPKEEMMYSAMRALAFGEVNDPKNEWIGKCQTDKEIAERAVEIFQGMKDESRAADLKRIKEIEESHWMKTHDGPSANSGCDYDIDEEIDKCDCYVRELEWTVKKLKERMGVV